MTTPGPVGPVGPDDHPENKPERAADYMNKRRPEPHTLEDLVAEPDPEEIRPATKRPRGRRSFSRQSPWWEHS